MLPICCLPDLQSSDRRQNWTCFYREEDLNSASIAAPKAWNTLPLNVRQNSNIETFKRRLKTFLFCKSYNIPIPTPPPADCICIYRAMHYVHSAVLRLHGVCLSVRLSVCNVDGL